MDGTDGVATSSTESLNNSVDAAETAVAADAAADYDGARAAQTAQEPATASRVMRRTALSADATDAGAPGCGGTASGAMLLQVRALSCRKQAWSLFDVARGAPQNCDAY